MNKNNDYKRTKMEKKFAIKVPFDGGFIFVTQQGKEFGEVFPVTFDSFESAKKASEIWGKLAVVVEYNE